MGDPLSVAGSAVGIVSLGLQVTKSLYNYYTHAKDQHSDAAHTAKKLRSLLDVLASLKPLLDKRTFRPSEENLCRSIESTIKECEECIQELKEEAEKFENVPITSLHHALRVAGRRVAYPLRQSTLQKLDENIGELVHQLSLALDSLQTKAVDRIQDDVDDVKAVLNTIRHSQISNGIQDWLKAPDASIDFNNGCKKKHAGTGLWFVKGPTFSAWLTQPSSFLWLKGFAGSGKSVLCATAIQHTLHHKRSDPKMGIAFFFFTFADDNKQDASAMLRALIAQLAGQLGGAPTALTQLHKHYRNTTPSDEDLLETLRQLITQFNNVYIILDAVDESPRETHRSSLLDILYKIRTWPDPGLHLLATSRDEVDICHGLQATPAETITMTNDGIDKDIASFVSQHLRSNWRLQKWQDHYEMIEQVLIQKANGV